MGAGSWMLDSTTILNIRKHVHCTKLVIYIYYMKVKIHDMSHFPNYIHDTKV